MILVLSFFLPYFVPAWVMFRFVSFLSPSFHPCLGSASFCQLPLSLVSSLLG